MGTQSIQDCLPGYLRPKLSQHIKLQEIIKDSLPKDLQKNFHCSYQKKSITLYAHSACQLLSLKQQQQKIQQALSTHAPDIHYTKINFLIKSCG